MNDIKLKVQSMSDDELIKDATDQYLLAYGNRYALAMAYTLVIFGILFLPLTFLFIPFLLIPLFSFFSARHLISKFGRNEKIKKVMFKELEKRGYKPFIKIGHGINKTSVTFIKNKY